jgi:L-fuculose-phosphate aldolase
MGLKRDLLHPRDDILRTIERIYRYRMTTTSGGNLSIREEDGDIWITPARLDKGSLRREDVVRVRSDGTAEGRHPPSSELPFHRAIYAARPELRGIVHAHPVALVAFSICRKVPDTRVLHQASAARSACTYALPGSERWGETHAQAFADGFNCVVCWRTTASSRRERPAARLSAFRDTELRQDAHQGGSARRGALSGRKTICDVPSPGPPECVRPRTGDERGKGTARQLCEFVRRSYRQRLMISTEGAFSAHLADDTFLITPRRGSRVARRGRHRPGARRGRRDRESPSRAVAEPPGNLASHPTVQAIVNAYPVNATAFGVTAAIFDSRTIPESYLFLRGSAPGGVQFRDGRELAALTSMRSPITILPNDGVQVCVRVCWMRSTAWKCWKRPRRR